MKRAASQPAPTTALPPPSTERGVDYGWRTHTAITDWTARVDAKASIVLGLGGVLLGFFVSLSANGRALSRLTGWHHGVEYAGLITTGLGVLLTASVVAPRLNRHRTKETWPDNFLYFGHLKHWTSVDLKVRLASLGADEELDVIAAQLVQTSKIAWRKHSALQWAMVLLVIGCALVVLAAMWPHGIARGSA